MVHQIFLCCIDVCNKLLLLITAIFMVYTYYSYNCLILDLRADSALFSLRQACKICPFYEFRLQKTALSVTSD